jgi:phosphonate transport system substrate-binding protein
LEFVEAEEVLPGLIALGKPVNAGGVSHYESVILVRSESGITSFADLSGRAFCFVSRRSTSGFRAPRVMLRQNGIDPQTDFSDRIFPGNHQGTLERLRRGGCDAASVYRNIWEQAEDTAAFEPLGFFGPIPNEQYVAHPDVEPDLVLQVREALMRLEEGSPAAQRVFGPHPQREYFTPNDPSDHNAARNIRIQERRFDLPVARRPAPAQNP